MNIQTKNKGFTIIEVVLVLAIAALIFLMVFIAFPALQRGQANTARKNDASAIAAAINTYRTNRNGTLPAQVSDLNGYVDKLAQLEIKGVSVGVSSDLAHGTDNSDLDKAQIYTGAKCKDDNTVEAGSKRQAAVETVLEISSGTYELFCTNA